MNSQADPTKIAKEIFLRTLAAIDVEAIVNAKLRLNGEQLSVGNETIDLDKFSRVIVIAIGKAAAPMARAVGDMLEDRILDGVVVTNALIGGALKRLPVLFGGHPEPNAASLEAGRLAIKLLREHDAEDTLVIFLISGGGSAMFEWPIDERLTLDDLRLVNRALVGCGAVIGEMNIVRRRLSAVKGGRLASAASRSRRISLYISDVNSDDLTTVASGPTLSDPSKPGDFLRVVDRYDLLNKFPPNVVRVIDSIKTEAVPESGSHHLLLDNRLALIEAGRIAADDFGFAVEIADDLVEGDVEEMARIHLERVERLRGENPGRGVCLISGGEVICPVRGNGEGGRNQEFVLRAAINIERRKMKDVVALSAGTDGIDGRSPAAGAVANDSTIDRAETLNISPEEHLQNSDSYNFFRTLGDAIITGPTGNNVRDLRILVSRSSD